MDNLKLGQIIEGTQHRDAVHVAVAPVVAAERLGPGQHIGLLDNGFASGHAKDLIGIVDPFLRAPVYKGERVWLFLYPGTITSLRHDWTHAAFDTARSSSASEEWLKGLAARVGLKYNILLEGADEWIRSDGVEYLCLGDLEGEYVPDEFWDHYEEVRQVTVPRAKRGSFFSCAC